MAGLDDFIVPPSGSPQAPSTPVSNDIGPVLSPTAQATFGNVITYGAPLLGVGLIDTLGQSLHLTDEKTVPNFMKTVFGSGPGGVGDFYARHQEGFRAGGESVGMFFPGMAGMKVLKTIQGAREAGSLGALLKNSVAMDVLLGNSAELSTAEAAIANATKTAVQDSGIIAGRTVATQGVINAKKGYYAKRAVDAARTTAAFEIGNAAAFNSSNLFYPPDTTVADQAKWVAGGFAVGLGVDFAMAKYAVRNIIQSVLKAESGPAMEAISPLAKDADKVLFRPQNRGVGITFYASVKQDMKNTIVVQGNNATLKTNLTQDITNFDGVLSEQIEKLGYDTHPFITRSVITPEMKSVALKALDTNPSVLTSAKKLAPVPTDPKEFYTNIGKKLEDAKTDYNTATFAASSKFGEGSPEYVKAISEANSALLPIEKAGNEIHYVLETDGTSTIFKNRAYNWLDDNSFKSIKRTTYTEPVLNKQGVEVRTKNSKLTLKADNELVLHDNFRAEIPAGATPKDFSALYAMGSNLIKDWKPVEHQTFIITPKVNWRTTEMTMALGEAKPEVRQSIQFGDDLTSPEDAQFHVLNEKFKEFTKLMPDTSRPTLGAFKSTSLLSKISSAKANYTPAQVIQRLNLPVTSGSQTSPVLELFSHAKLQGMKDLNDFFPAKFTSNQFENPTSQYDLLQQHLREIAGATDPSTIIPISGNLLKQTDEAKPLFVAATAVPLMARADEQIMARVQAMRDVHMERLGNIDPATSPLLTGVIGKIVKSSKPVPRIGEGGSTYQGIAEGGDLAGAANEARGVQTLHDGILTGTGQVVYQDRINEQFPTLKALQLVAQDGDKFVENYVKMLADASLTPKYATILAPKNKADLVDFNRIEQSYRHGWEVEKSAPAGGNGVSFKLKEDSRINAQLKELHFPGEDPEQIYFLPDMSTTAKKMGYSPLTVSKNSSDLAQAISDMSIQSGKENNALRLALGHNPIKLRDFHLPTPELNKEGTWFVQNSQGKVVATYTGVNFKQNEQRAKDASVKLGQTYTALPLETIKAQHQIIDDNFMDLIDYSDQIAKTGAGIQGGLAHTEIDTGPVTLKAMIRSLQEQYLNIGIRGRAAVFEPELNYAKQAQQTATEATRENFGHQNIFDRYIATMFSRSPNNNKGQFGKFYGGAESSMDKALSVMSAHYTDLIGTEEATRSAKVVRALVRKQSSDEEFAQYAKLAPEWSPFKETQDWAESTFREKSALTSKELAADLSRVSSTMSLRFLDAGTALNNFSGLLTNSPSIVYGLRRKEGEAFEAWISRTAAWGTQLKDGTMTFSPMKSLGTAVKALWKGELNGPMKDAAKQGYHNPEYAALQEALTMPVKPSTKALSNFIKHASTMADKSEIMSRQIAWGMGYKIGKDLHGFTDERDTYIFANNFVNEMIGNYSPNNKPAMFQGAVGLPLGTFQTYMSNFYRRLFNNIERGDKAALMSQYAAQASVFGAQSVPGYQGWNMMFQTNDAGSDDFTTRLNTQTAPGVSELLLHGSLSNIPKIWGGMQGNAWALYSRGSVDYTQPPPTFLEMSRSPPAQFLAETYKGINATINNIFSGGGFSLQQQEEILARFSTNRAVKSIMEMAADVKTNDRGTVIDSSTRDFIHFSAAMLGTQTSNTRAQQDAMRRERLVQLTQEDLRTSLNDHTRAMVRGGELSVDKLQSIVHDYLKSGGSPQYLGSWFRNTIITAESPAAQKQLEQLGRSQKFLEFQNMLSTLQQNQGAKQ